MQIRKAERRKAKLRLGIASVSGAGKTYSSLLLAFGLGGKVGLIDTENGSGDLYAHLGDYDVIPLTAPYTVAKYREAVKAFESAGYTTIIIDSLSHAWAGEGGLLDKQGKMADAGGNSYTAWRKVTPEHNALVESILQSPCHIIATMRSKQEYVQEKNEQGKTVIRKVGLAPVQRDGMEYEFTVMMDIGADHTAYTTKDRTGLFDGVYFKVTPETGKTLLSWLESGKDAPKPAPAPVQEAPKAAAPAKAPAATAMPARYQELTQSEILLTMKKGLTTEAAKELKATFQAPEDFMHHLQGLQDKAASELKKATGEIEAVKSAKTGNGMRYGLKLKGSAAIYGTASAPAAARAEGMIGARVEVSYKEEAGKLHLVGFDPSKS